MPSISPTTVQHPGRGARQLRTVRFLGLRTLLTDRAHQMPQHCRRALIETRCVASALGMATVAGWVGCTTIGQ